MGLAGYRLNRNSRSRKINLLERNKSQSSRERYCTRIPGPTQRQENAHLYIPEPYDWCDLMLR